MKIICAQEDHAFDDSDEVLNVVLYKNADRPSRGSAGRMVKDEIARQKLIAAGKAWDLMSLAMAVSAADLAGHRAESADGWTRVFEIDVSVADPDFWNSQTSLVEEFLNFLTTDTWRIHFIGDGFQPTPPQKPDFPVEDCVSLLSGGLDSFIGNVDLVADGKKILAVSHVVRGDAEKQTSFANTLGIRHLQLNHNAEVPDKETPPSQRARSLTFLAYGVLAATTLKTFHDGAQVPLYVCENGFISINPPLTEMRLGSLSTRTTHPVFLSLVQRLLNAADLRVLLLNPYQLKTKGEMLKECKNQTLLHAYASQTTSCGRFLQNGYKHCGRCVPCLVRRAAFISAGVEDTTVYRYKNLGKNDAQHAGFDDVRSVAMAVSEVQTDGLESWLGMSLSTALLGDVCALESMVGRGLDELKGLLNKYGVT